MSFSKLFQSSGTRVIAAALALFLSFFGQAGAQGEPRTGKFVFQFQQDEDPTYQAFVVPLDFQTGLPMIEGSLVPWNGAQSKYMNEDMFMVGDSVNSLIVSQITGPLAYFGSAVGASTMYEDMSYRFALHTGDAITNQRIVGAVGLGVEIKVFAKSAVNGGDIKSPQTFYLPLPFPGVRLVDPVVSATAAMTAGNTTITVSSASGLVLHESVNGPGIPPGVTVASISGTSLVLSAAPTASGSGVALTFGGARPWVDAFTSVSVTAGTTSGSATITVPSTADMVPGEWVSTTGGDTRLPPGTMILSVVNSTTLLLSSKATVTGSASLIIGGPGAWTAFGDNGYQAVFSVYGDGPAGPGTVNLMDTIVQIVLPGEGAGNWGDKSLYSGPLLITHKAHAGAEKYYFMVSSLGQVTRAGGATYYMTSDSHGNAVPTMGYAMNFDPQSSWSSKLLTTPSFQGTPMPAAYYGKSTTEIESQAAPVALLNLAAPTVDQATQRPTQFINIGATPELQRHSVLDKFVAQMGNNPLALAAYVQNQIALTDALAYNNHGDLNEASVNAGGMERAAVGTFLEGQGSPEEQCALLVYLLRQAGYAAAYVTPGHNSLMLTDQRLSNLLRMRIAGALAPDGTPNSVPQFIYCNYPYVAAYLPANGTSGASKWVPLFPWLKDTDVEQGLNVNNYLPNGVTDIRQWVRKFLMAKSNDPMWNSDTSPLSSATLTNCGITQNSQVVTVPSTAGLIVGQTVEGGGFPAGTLVASVGDASGTRTLTCSTTINNTSVTVQVGVGTVGLSVGQLVSGSGIASGTTIASISGDGTTLTLSTNATATSAAAGLTFTNPPPSSSSLNCYTTAGSPTVTLYTNYFTPYTTAGLSVGMQVSGNGIPSGATIAAITDTTTLTLSANATATNYFYTALTFTSVAVNKPTVVLTQSTSSATSSSASLTFKSWDRTPGGFFVKALSANLQQNYPGISVADMGVSFLDRKYNYTNWDQFPQPIPLWPRVYGATTLNSATVTGVANASSLVPGLAVSGPNIPDGTTITGISGTTLTLSNQATSTNAAVALTIGTSCAPSETLSADGSLYDTVDITITSDQHPTTKIMTIPGVRIMDLHNRRAVINFIPAGPASTGAPNSYTLNFDLAPYDLANPGSGTGNFSYPSSGDTYMRLAQRASMTVDSTDQSYSLSVVYRRYRSYAGTTSVASTSLGEWPDFLGLVMGDFSPNSFSLTATTASGSKTVTLADTSWLTTGMHVSGTGIPGNTLIDKVVNGTSITLTNAASAGGSVALTFGGGSTPPQISSFFLGDLNAFCLNTGRVTPAMLNMHMQYYNQVQQQLQGTTNNALVPGMLDSMQGSLAYLMGMNYYQRMSTSMASLKNLFQVHAVSTRAHGFALFGAQKARNTSSGALVLDNANNPLPLVVTPANAPSNTYRILQTYPKVDMKYSIETHVGYDDLRADAGGQGTAVTPDFYFNLMIAQASSLESQTIAQYFDGQNTDAISTFSLLQKVQLGLNGTANPSIVELNLSNYATLGDTVYVVNGVSKKLSDWAGSLSNPGSIWSSIVAAFNRWDGSEVRVYMTPGDSIGANGQWKGMVALIMSRDQAGALIGALNSLNGGLSSSVSSIGYNSGLAGMTIQMNTFGGLDEGSITTSAGNSYAASSTNYGSIGALSLSQQTSLVYASATTSVTTDLTSTYSWNIATTVMAANGGMNVGTLRNLSSTGGDALYASAIGGMSPNLMTTLGQNNAAALTINNNAPGISLLAGDPVNTLTGELYADETDLVLPGPLPLQIRRNYSSRSLGSGEFGYGWKAGMFPYLVISTNNGVTKIQAAEMDGTVITYSPQAGSSTVWGVAAADNPLLSNGDGMSLGSVRNPYYNTITFTSSGGVSTYALKGADGSVRVYTVKSYPIGSGSTAVARQRPYLTSWTDSVGNSLTFYYFGDGTGAWYSVSNSDPAYGQLAGVQASNGNSVSFNYDAYGHITNIATADGRQLNYTYDANGDLRQVDFPDGSWTKYDYLVQIGKVGTSTTTAPYSTHLISQETRPGGRQVQTYYVKFKSGDLDENGAQLGALDPRVGNDVSTARRVDHQLSSVGKGVLKTDGSGTYDSTKPVTDGFTMVQNAKYNYDNLTTDSVGNVNGRTEITDAYGRKTIYYYVNSRLVQIMDPLSTITDVATGTGSNPKMVQTWYTTTDSMAGAWAGGLRSLYQRGGTLTTFEYSPKVENNPPVAGVPNTPGGDVVKIKVSGYLDGTDIPEGTSISVTSTSTTGPGPVLQGFVSHNTAVTSLVYDGSTHLPRTVTKPHPTSVQGGGHCILYTYDTARHYLMTSVIEYDRPVTLDNTGSAIIGSAIALSTVSTTYQNPDPSESKNGVVTKFANGLPAVVTNNGAVTTWTYNANGFPTRKEAASGQASSAYPNLVVQYSYDLRGQLYQEQVMSGGSAAKTNLYAYDEMGRPIWVERRDGNGKQIGWNYTYYNLNGDVEWTQGSRLDPADYTYTSYDGAGHPVEKTSWRSRARADHSGVEALPGADVYATTLYSYNMFGDLLGVTDPVGNSVQVSYDDIGRKTGTTAYQGNWQTASTNKLATTQTTYNDAELYVATTDARGGITKTYSTSDGKTRKRINPDNTQLNWLYFLDGRIKRQPLTATTYVDFDYDDAHYTMTKTFTNSSSGTFQEIVTTDARGNVTSTTDVAGFTTTTTYDNLDRPMLVSVPVGSITGVGTTSAARSFTHAYDAAGLMHKITNSAQEVTQTDSDALGRPVRTQVLSGSNVVSQRSIIYSPDFQSVTTISGDPNGTGAISETAWTDLAGRTVMVKHADNTYATVAYDAVGNATASTDEVKQTTVNTYDGLQRLLTTTLPDGAQTQFTYTYLTGSGQSGGQAIQRQMPGGLMEYTRTDAQGRPQERYLQGSDGTKKRHYQNYNYFLNGKEQGLLQNYTDPIGYTHSITYDDWLRPFSTTAGTSGSAAYVRRDFPAYDKRGMPTQIIETTAAGVSQIDRSYDGQGHLYEEKVTLGGTTVITDLTATYDNAGRRDSLTSVGASGGSWGFHYQADGRLSKVGIAGGDFTYAYGDNGLLQSRTNPFRTFNVTTTNGTYGRDARGRILNTKTTLATTGATVISENIASWTGDNKQNGYSCWHQSSDLASPGNPAAWTDSRSYSYSDQRRKLTSESWTNSPDKVNLSVDFNHSATQTLNYTFDRGNAGGLGVRTLAATNTVGTAQQHSVTNTGLDAWSRITAETGGFERRFPRSIEGKAPGAASVDLRVGPSASLNLVSFPDVTATSSGDWSRSLSLPAGRYALKAIASHPSQGQFNGQVSSSFTMAVHACGVTEAYDDAGNVTQRTVIDTFDSSATRTQDLKWDAEGRLMSVTQSDTSTASQAFVWRATYDALGRRIRTQTQFTGGCPQAGRTLTETSWHDPLVEFLEVGLEVSWSTTSSGTEISHERWWKVHGPDLSGGYGGLQGMGGLEAMFNAVTGEAVGFIDDVYGHMLGFAAAPGNAASPSSSPLHTPAAVFEWNVSRFGGYGPLPGYWSPAIADSAATWRTFGWHGKRMDVTGYYHLGARDYDCNGGRFLSADPLGYAASMSLYDYAGGDPINFVDPRGREYENVVRPDGKTLYNVHSVGDAVFGGPPLPQYGYISNKWFNADGSTTWDYWPARLVDMAITFFPSLGSGNAENSLPAAQYAQNPYQVFGTLPIPVNAKAVIQDVNNINTAASTGPVFATATAAAVFKGKIVLMDPVKAPDPVSASEVTQVLEKQQKGRLGGVANIEEEEFLAEFYTGLAEESNIVSGFGKPESAMYTPTGAKVFPDGHISYPSSSGGKPINQYTSVYTPNARGGTDARETRQGVNLIQAAPPGSIINFVPKIAGSKLDIYPANAEIPFALIGRSGNLMTLLEASATLGDPIGKFDKPKK